MPSLQATNFMRGRKRMLGLTKSRVLALAAAMRGKRLSASWYSHGLEQDSHGVSLPSTVVMGIHYLATLSCKTGGLDLMQLHPMGVVNYSTFDAPEL
ncbi:hypothetical protein LZ554_000167 [Drepanopeziza brunnea f. sp. 'monogermtubi']|nr:hypothetical protein LZ554_000167 [Drepanopeziza brunnea f. sp. 'monogermtubi']